MIIEIVTGATAADTIEACLAVTPAAILHDSTGKPPYHAPITFTRVTRSGA
jgi:hypothetical protein